MDNPGPSFILNQFINLAEGDSATEGLVFKIILLIVLIFINAFFAMSEIAIISLNDAKMEKMAEDGNKKAKMVLKLTSNSTRFLSTIQIGVTLAGFLSSASASTAFASMLTNAITKAVPSVPSSLVAGVSVVVITLITSYFSLVLGELAPKRIGMQASEKVAFAVVKPLLVISKITAPFVKFLSLSTNAVVRLCGFDPNADEETVTEEEIRMMVDGGGEKGVIEDTQKEMINNIFEFDDIVASDIMTHRTDVIAADVNDTTLDEFMALAIGEAEKGILNKDGGPFGSVIVKDGVVVAVGHNEVVKNNSTPETIERITARLNGEFNFFYNAPILILVTSCNALYPEADCACAIENMYLRATDLGLGACWINQLTKVKYPELKEFLKKSGLDENYVVYGALAIGYTDEQFTTKEKKNRIIVVR